MKRKGYPSRYDRKQDAKIRKLEQNIILKEHTAVLSGSDLVDGVFQFFYLNGVAQGETDTTREGSSIHMQSISIRWSIRGSAVTTVSSGNFRIVLFIDNDPRGLAPTAIQVFTSDDILSGYNTGRVIGQERSRGRFRFLYDETFDIINRPIASADSLPSTKTGKIFAKLGGTRAMWTDDSGNFSKNEEHSLNFGIIVQNQVQAAVYSFNSILRFTAPD